jgi:DNA-binding response OmpR family regulator
MNLKESKIILFSAIILARGDLMRILIVEDEVRLATSLQFILENNNHIVDVALDGESGLDKTLSGVYDVVILDYMLPVMSGIEILKEAREYEIQSSIIMLTAKGELSDKLLGLNTGADDYLVKPFETEELLARVSALGRRRNFSIEKDQFKYNDITLEPTSMRLICGKEEIELSLKEKEIMELLISRKQMITPKVQILEKVWGYDSDALDNNVEVYISFIRKKMKAVKSTTTIKTVRGVGYTLEGLDV